MCPSLSAQYYFLLHDQGFFNRDTFQKQMLNFNAGFHFQAFLNNQLLLLSFLSEPFQVKWMMNLSL
jgi:hypothetical protein